MALTVKNTLKLAEKYVANSAKVLDAKVPGWQDKIDLEKLNMAHATYCISGQLSLDSYGSYSDLSFEEGFWWISAKHKLPKALRFVDKAEHRSMREKILKDFWVKEIEQRLAV